MIRTSLICLAIAVAMRLAFDQATAQTPTPTPKTNNTHMLFAPGKIGLEWMMSDGEIRVWMSVDNFTRPDWPKEGWNPSYTAILSHYKPIVTKLKNGQWQVSFTSEIAENIP